MNAIATKKARSLTTALVVLGIVGTTAFVAACKSDDSTSDDSNEGIGLNTLAPVANAPESATPIDATPSPDGSQIYYIAYASHPDDDTGKMLKVRTSKDAPNHWLIRGEGEMEDTYDEAGSWMAAKAKADDGSTIEYRRV